MHHTVYLEAATKTQDVLTTKWILRSCGYVVASTWHEEPTNTSSGERHRLEEMRSCDTLVVVGNGEQELAPQLAFAIGYAAARDLRIIFLGEPVDLPGCFTRVQFLATPEDLRRLLLLENAHRLRRTSETLLAA